MKRYVILTFIFLFIFNYILPSTIHTSGSTVMAADPSVFDTMKKGQSDQTPPVGPLNNEVAKADSSTLFPLLLKFILSFAFVIVLLVILLKVLSKRTRILQSNGPILPIAGYPLGNNRSVQVVLVGETIYILGVGDSVNLIRAISQGEEYQLLLKGYENQADGISFVTKDLKQKWNQVFGKHMSNMDQENGEE